MHLVLNGEKREDSGVVMVGRTQRHGEGQMWGMVEKALSEVMVHLRDASSPHPH